MKQTKCIYSLLLIAILAFLFVINTVTAQAPPKMSYQAVVRNSSNKLVANTQVGMRISILQGSAAGTVVYNELQTPLTNANGLLSIEIGGGTGFDAIQWQNNPYFIKTEIDPTGGTNYTIIGTNQFLSVPYALHAKTTDSITETDPVFGASPAKGITSNDTNNWNTSYSWGNHQGLYRPVNWVPDWADITGKPTIDGTETKVQAGSNVSVTGIGTTDNPYIVSSTGGFTHYIGELFGGGIVVAVWKVSGEEHGLIASLTDVSDSAAWSNVWNFVGTAQSLVDGLSNTNAIIAQNGHTLSAAKLCRDYTAGGFTDWYLPAIWELEQCKNVYLIINIILGSANGFHIGYCDSEYKWRKSCYWSSTEYSNVLAPFFLNLSGCNLLIQPKTEMFSVRAVRRF